MKKLKNIAYNLSPLISLTFIFLIWIISSSFLPKFILPSPKDVFLVFFTDFDIILSHSITTLTEAFLGLSLSIIFAFFLAIMMDRYKIMHKSIYPILIITQTIPSVCLAPLIILWFGYGVFAKVILIFIVCFFPLLISILNGFESIDKEIINLIKSMNASYFQMLFFVKIPLCLKSFFSGLKIAASYSIVGAVVVEWLGGEKGLGVYMTRVRKSYEFNKMFAVIIIISFLSLGLIEIIKLIEKRAIKWEKLDF